MLLYYLHSFLPFTFTFNINFKIDQKTSTFKIPVRNFLKPSGHPDNIDYSYLLNKEYGKKQVLVFLENRF